MDSTRILLTNIIKKQASEAGAIQASAKVARELSVKVIEGIRYRDAIKVIIGPRRAGKSTLMLQAIASQPFAYFNFEDEDLNFDYSGEELIQCLEAIYPNSEIFAFDEVQLCPSWEKLVNRLQRLGKNVIITGSNSKLLSAELSSSLTGRYLEYQLLPFSYSEYLAAIKSTDSSGDNAPKREKGLATFLEYLKHGGFPSVVTNRFPEREFLSNLWDSIILKDLVQRYKIRRVAEFKSLLYLILMSMSCRASHRSLSRSLNEQLTHSSVAKFIDWAESAYLCSALQTFSDKPRKRVNSEKKFYLYDNGFYSAHKVSGQDDFGKLLENHVFIELCRQGLRPNLELFTYRSGDGSEIDFVILPRTGPKKLIQVAFSTSAQRTLDRETRALVRAAKEQGITTCIVVTCDPAEKVLAVEGITIRFIRAWDLGDGLLR